MATTAAADQPDPLVGLDASAIEMPVSQALPEALTLTLTRDVPAGALLRLRAGGVQLLMGTVVESIAGPDGQPLAIEHRFSMDEMKKDWSWHINTLSMAIARTPAALPAGSTLRLALRPKSREGEPSYDKPFPGLNPFAGLTWSMALGTVADARALDFAPASGRLDMSFISDKPAEIAAYLKPDGRVLVAYQDMAWNPARPAEPRPELKAAGSALELKPAATAAAWTAWGQAPAGAERVTVADAALGIEAVSNPRPLALDGTPVWFGEFHWHSNFSGDGQRSIADALASARDELGLDFAGTGDHIGPNGAYHHGLTPADQVAIHRQFEQPGRFATITGAELSLRNGHANTYAESGALWESISAQYASAIAPLRTLGLGFPHEAMNALCPAGRALYIPHHTNMDSWVVEKVVMPDGRPAWSAMRFARQPQPACRLFEIHQERGTFESEQPDPAWDVRFGGFGASARTALARGWRMGFVGASDNHCGWPTRGSGGRPVGLTGVIAPALDQQGLFDALYARRCYATTGARIVADATLNGQPIGSELKLAPDAARAFKIMVKGTAPLEKVQIISMDAVLADLPIEAGALDCALEWSDDRPGRPLDGVYYYVRVRQRDGQCAWLSPWWVDLQD